MSSELHMDKVLPSNTCRLVRSDDAEPTVSHLRRSHESRYFSRLVTISCVASPCKRALVDIVRVSSA